MDLRRANNARKLFENLEAKNRRSVKEVVKRVKNSSPDISEEALRRFRIQERLNEIQKKEFDEFLKIEI